MREFERALERGQDTVVATLVLEQLRKIVRKTEAEEAAPPRTDDLSRLLFQVLEPFLVEDGAPEPGRPDPPLVTVSDLAMAGPRRRPGQAG